MSPAGERAAAASTGSTTSTASNRASGRGSGASSRATGSGGTTTTGAPHARPRRCRLLPRAVRLRQRGPQAAVRLVCLDGAGPPATRSRPGCATRASPTRPAPCSSSRPGARSCGCSSARGPAPARHRRAKLEGGPERVRRVRAAHPGRPTDRHARRARPHERTLGSGGGLLAATRIEAQQPTWLVTGVDAAGVAASAAALSEQRAGRPLLDRRRGGPHGAAAGGRSGAGPSRPSSGARARCTRPAPGSARPGA